MGIANFTIKNMCTIITKIRCTPKARITNYKVNTIGSLFDGIDFASCIY
jgi:hypothetical protein